MRNNYEYIPIYPYSSRRRSRNVRTNDSRTIAEEFLPSSDVQAVRADAWRPALNLRLTREKRTSSEYIMLDIDYMIIRKESENVLQIIGKRGIEEGDLSQNI